MAPDLDAWIGRTECADDVVTAGLLARWAALVGAPLGAELPRGELAPGAHWALCLPHDSVLAADGHPPKGGFLPPVALPRRMWAGGRVEWLDSAPLGAQVERRSTIEAIRSTTGASGALVFVTVGHELHCGETVVVRERQDIVYRDPAASQPGGNQRAADRAAANQTAVEQTTADLRQTIEPTVPWLFRFSALTFNAHRIHYDRPFATVDEGYDGLVVHGPLLAALMATLAAQHATARGTRLRSMDFRALRPVFDTGSFDVCATTSDGGTIEAWIEFRGRRCTEATIKLA